MTSRMLDIRAIASWEMRGAARTRWVLGAAVLHGAGAIALTLVGLRSLRDLGLSGVGAAIDGLVALGLLLPPLIGLLLGAASMAGGREQGTLTLVAAQPIRRSSVPVGIIAGLTTTVSVAVLVGLGVAAVLIAPVVTGSDLAGFGVATMASLAAATVGVTVGVLISALSTSRSQATAIAAAVWFAAALGIDLLLAAVGPGLRLGPVGFLWAVLLNPLEAIRILALLATDSSSLGPFGVYMFDRFGTPGTAGIIGGALALWITVPAVVAGWVFKRRDV
jgi:Cu-processing system permease protein